MLVPAVSASAAGSHGPLTCLDGFVWRQATPRDHVCVTPEVRAQTARDNALAPTRVSATSGTFGPDLCVAGFVWRDALPGDRVCVTPATWQQVHDDNLTAGARRNALRVHIGTYGAADTSTPRYWVRADGINVGMARVALFWPGAGTPAMSWPVRARPRSTAPGGELLFTSRLPVCGRHAELRDPRPRPARRCAGPRRGRSRPAAPACRGSTQRPRSNGPWWTGQARA